MLDNSVDMFEPSCCFDPTQQDIINWNNLNNNNNNLNNNNDHTQQQQPDLLNLFQLPKCSSSICFSNPLMDNNSNNYDNNNNINGLMYHDLLMGMHNNVGGGGSPQPPYIRELLSSLPNGFNITGGCGGSIFGEMEMERGEQSHHGMMMFHEGGGGCDGVSEFGKGNNNNNGNGKELKHFATEKHRRQQLNGKFEALKSLVPNPTKADRASVVGDAIEYINELKRTMEELKILVDRKRCNRGRMKKHKNEDDSTLDVESIYTMSNGGTVVGLSNDTTDDQQAYNGNLTPKMRSSWLQRKSKNTEIEVRIIDDEVTIKLVQQKRINCMRLVCKVLDELKLDIHHVAGGLIGDFYSYLFNTKICEGSSVYASAIANKLIEAVDKQYAAIPVTSSY